MNPPLSELTAGLPSPAPRSGPIRVLLYSIKGSGLHYTGGGMTAYRMYSRAEPGHFKLTLTHARADQGKYDLFSDYAFMGAFNSNPLQQWRVLRNSLNWVRVHAAEFDVFHGLHGYHITARTAFEAQRRGLPAIIKIAMHRGDLSDKPGLRTLLGLPQRRRKMVKQLAGVVATSSAIFDELRSYGFTDSQIARIPNGVDTDLFAPPVSSSAKAEARRSLGWDERPVILFSGVVNERKRPHLLIEAMAELKHRRALQCVLVLSGPMQEGSYAHRLRALIQQHSLQRDVLLPGFVADMPNMLRAADVFALPSRSEGMPNALLEAMASGLPSIASPISGVIDLIQDGIHGRLVPPDAAAIADALAEYLQSEKLRDQHGHAARQQTLGRFSIHSVVKAYEAMFRRIMAGGCAAE